MREMGRRHDGPLDTWSDLLRRLDDGRQEGEAGIVADRTALRLIARGTLGGTTEHGLRRREAGVIPAQSRYGEGPRSEG